MMFPAFNLLGPQHRRTLQSEYWFGFLSRVLFGFSLVASVFLLLLGTIFVYLLFVRNAQEALLDILEKQPQLTQAKTLEANIRDASLLIKTIDDAMQESNPLFSDTFRKIIAALPSGVLLETANFQRQVKEGTIRVTVNVSGTAATRQDVLTFERALKGLDNFVSLDSPIENIVPSHNAKLRMTLVLK